MDYRVVFGKPLEGKAHRLSILHAKVIAKEMGLMSIFDMILAKNTIIRSLCRA
jgi:hypothetical protein